MHQKFCQTKERQENILLPLFFIWRSVFLTERLFLLSAEEKFPQDFRRIRQRVRTGFFQLLP